MPRMASFFFHFVASTFFRTFTENVLIGLETIRASVCFFVTLSPSLSPQVERALMTSGWIQSNFSKVNRDPNFDGSILFFALFLREKTVAYLRAYNILSAYNIHWAIICPPLVKPIGL